MSCVIKTGKILPVYFCTLWVLKIITIIPHHRVILLIINSISRLIEVDEYATKIMVWLLWLIKQTRVFTWILKVIHQNHSQLKICILTQSYGQFHQTLWLPEKSTIQTVLLPSQELYWIIVKYSSLFLGIVQLVVPEKVFNSGSSRKITRNSATEQIIWW